MTYLSQNESYWDKAEQKTKHHRKCIGKFHPETSCYPAVTDTQTERKAHCRKICPVSGEINLTGSGTKKCIP